MKKLMAAFLSIWLFGCVPQPTTPKEPPKTLSKKITGKQADNYTENELDGTALIMGGKWRSVPVMKTHYRLYAEDGTYLDVNARRYATTKEGDEVEAQEKEWK